MNGEDGVYLSLMKAIMIQMRCENISDLRYLNDGQRAQLACSLERISPERASLFDWNDALDYLVQAHPEPTPQAAKNRLITLLSQPRKEATHNK